MKTLVSATCAPMSATDPWNYPVKLYLEESPLWLDFHQIMCQEVWRWWRYSREASKTCTYIVADKHAAGTVPVSVSCLARRIVISRSQGSDFRSITFFVFFDVGPFVEIVFWLFMALYFVQNMLRFPRKDFLCVQEKNLHPWWEEIPT